MKWLTKDEVRAYLRRHGVPSHEKVEKILLGFDFDKPVYEQALEVKQQLYQFIRNPSHSDRIPNSGSWFSLPGASMKGLAIFGGESGRRLHRFEVAHELTAIEGTAAALPREWSWAGGGHGGLTQLFIPPSLVGRLHSLGPQ